MKLNSKKDFTDAMKAWALALEALSNAAPSIAYCIDNQLPPTEECMALYTMQTKGNTDPKQLHKRSAEILPKISPRLAKQAHGLFSWNNIKILSSERHPTYLHRKSLLGTPFLKNALSSVNLRKQDTAAATGDLANCCTYFLQDTSDPLFKTAVPRTAELLTYRHQEQAGMVEKRVEGPILDFAMVSESITNQKPMPEIAMTLFCGSLAALQFSDMILDGKLKFDDLLDDKNQFPEKFEKFGVTADSLLEHAERYIKDQKEILDRYDDSKPMNRKKLIEIYLR